MPGVQALEPELRDLSARLRRLKHDLQTSADGAAGSVTLVCQHAITTTISPWIVKELTLRDDVSVRVRSGNRDECLTLLLSGEADFAVTYEGPEDHTPLLPRGFDTVDLGIDQLVPVCTPDLLNRSEGKSTPIIAYPSDVFLGRIFQQHIAPRLPASTSLSPKAETALTLAACEYALGGIGIAWLPMTLVAQHLNSGRLHRAFGLPEQSLRIVMIRLVGSPNTRKDQIWHMLLSHPNFPSGL
jgi:DNA-binding transcriptional LysR family regulator